jgi:sulfate-transporting ATPase
VNRVGESPVTVASIFPADRWTWGSLGLLSDRLYLTLSIVGLTLGLAALYRWTRFGLLTRAVAETQTGAIVSGVAPERIALLNWMVSAVVAGAAGILIAPITPLTPTAYALAVVPALAAAAVGHFELLVPTVIAGIGIGMLQSEALTFAGTHTWFPHTGSAELIPLVVIIGALLVGGRGIPARGGVVRQRLGRAPRPRALLVPTIVGIALGTLALVLTSGTWRSAVIATLIAAILGLSYVVVTGLAGQVSLAQLALAGVSAFALSGLTTGWGVPFPIAPLLAAIVATFAGIVVGLPALRLRGLTLGVVTLALAYAIEALWFRNGQFVSSGGAIVKSPRLFGLDLGVGTGRVFPRLEFGFLCLATLVVVSLGVAWLRRSALGSAMLAVRANERSAAGIGVNVTRVKIASFAIASFIAGIGGSLFAYRQGVVTFASFTAIGGLALLATAYLAGITSVSGGILGGVLATSGVVFLALDRWAHLGVWFSIISGVALIATVIGYPEGLVAAGHGLVKRMPDLRVVRRQPQHPSPQAIDLSERVVDRSVPSLEVEHLTVRYGGVVAVSDVSMRIEAGSVVGLIGPNGAGKTSLIDAVTGFARAEGSIRLHGEPVDELAVHARVRRGLARTFQSLELYDDLTVEENVSAALFNAPPQRRHVLLNAALDRAGLSSVREHHAGELSQGERQLVSIARACASGPTVLLLDEPAAGLGPADSARLGERIRNIASSGTAVLLIDHDIALVLEVCDHVYVLDFGSLVSEGDAATIRADRALAEAYLGSLHDTRPMV